MRVISYGEPSMFGNPSDKYLFGRKRKEDDCDYYDPDCKDCEHDHFCEYDCPRDWGPWCEELECDCHCEYDD